MKTLPVALQVYSIRDDAEKDFVKAMQEVKSMGYEGVELAGLYGHTPEEIRDILKEIGLTPISAHVPYQELEQNLQKTVKCYAIIGCRFIAIPYLTDEYRYGTDKFEEVMKYIPSIAKACHTEGITLLYHNHDFEFLKTTEDEYILDFMYQQIPEEELKVELDTCWVKVVGINPSDYMKKYAGRLPVVHLKDFNGETPLEFRALGQGVQDVPSLLEEAIRGGSEWVVVEQDSHTQYSALEDVRLSREYLKTLGW
jgi:sugar phosphate isomerase/epimerase